MHSSSPTSSASVGDICRAIIKDARAKSCFHMISLRTVLVVLQLFRVGKLFDISKKYVKSVRNIGCFLCWRNRAGENVGSLECCLGFGLPAVADEKIQMRLEHILIPRAWHSDVSLLFDTTELIPQRDPELKSSPRSIQHPSLIPMQSILTTSISYIRNRS
mmetsp:Transcript_7090/g.16570  ORF Transcript_7090/g.16570 Transcript_7090/m.16570 type:complete len:161 (+) Transcript_7090:1052-1534(+)